MPRSENQSECSIGGLEWVNESYWVLGYSKSDLAPLWVTKYPRCKDFESKGEGIYKINNITEIIQCPGLKIDQSVA